MQRLLARATAAVEADAAAAGHAFVKAAQKHIGGSNLDALALKLTTGDPFDVQLQFGLAVRDGFGASATFDLAPTDKVRGLAVAIGLVIAERLVHVLQPLPHTASDAPVGLEDACLAAIVAAGWLGVGLALVWDPGRPAPTVLNLITDVSEQQLCVADAMDVLNLEVRCKASELLGLPRPSGAGAPRARLALIKQLQQQKGLKPVVGLRVGDFPGAGAAGSLLAEAKSRLKQELGIELFRFGAAPSAVGDAERRAWKELADELQDLLGHLRRAYPQPMAAPAQPGKSIFISYARGDDRALLEAVHGQLSVLGAQGVTVWGDVKKINTGDRWEDRINEGLEQCSMAVLLVSSRFVNSSFINRKELPRLLARAEAGEVALYPVLASSVATAHLKWLQPLQMFCQNKALNLHTPAEREALLAQMVDEVSVLLAAPRPANPASRKAP